MKMKMNNRQRNKYFWFGIFGVIFAAAGINFEMLTSWKLLFDAVLSILNNPVAIVSVLAALSGVWVDSTTNGFNDTK